MNPEKDFENTSIFKLLKKDYQEGFCINPTFCDSADYINESILDSSDKSRYYNNGLDVQLMKDVREHAKEFNKETDAKSWVTLIHPFYMFTIHYGTLVSHLKENCQKYSNNLVKLLTAGLDRDKINLVLIEMPEIYAATTSLLLEEGLIDKVLFTERGYGNLLDNNFLNIPNRNYFIGGGYNRRCVTSFIKNHLNKNRGNVYPIFGLLTNPTNDSGDFFPRNIEEYRIDAIYKMNVNKTLNLDEVIKEFREN